MITYQDAGVDVHRGYEVVQRIQRHVKSTFSPAVLAGLGGFGGLFELDTAGYQQPVLVSGTDGVGTKLKLAFALDIHHTVGIDLVAMCANDLLCTGAKPLFFLDYVATGQLRPETIEQVVAGIATGCRQVGCALIGGETAEMPDFYSDGEYDLAGFAVGLVDKPHIIDGSRIQAGDVLIGLPSSGVHSNGFSLVRKVFDIQQLEVPFGNRTLGEVLLEPTRIYVPTVLPLLSTFPIHGIAHITGGGFIENIPRIVPETFSIEIWRESWEILPIFEELQQRTQLEEYQMFNTFNMGIGLVLIVPANQADAVLHHIHNSGEKAYQMGQIIDKQEDRLCFVSVF